MLLRKSIILCFFLMIRRPPRSTLDRSSAASDVYKRQGGDFAFVFLLNGAHVERWFGVIGARKNRERVVEAVSYTHLRAHETVLDLVCRLLLEKKKNKTYPSFLIHYLITYTSMLRRLITAPTSRHPHLTH